MKGTGECKEQLSPSLKRSMSALHAVWSAEHLFSEADRMALAARFVQQALDRNDVCHVRLSAPTAANGQ